MNTQRDIQREYTEGYAEIDRGIYRGNTQRDIQRGISREVMQREYTEGEYTEGYTKRVYRGVYKGNRGIYAEGHRGICRGNIQRDMQREYIHAEVIHAEGTYRGICRGNIQRDMQREYTEGIYRGICRGNIQRDMQRGYTEGYAVGTHMYVDGVKVQRGTWDRGKIHRCDYTMRLRDLQHRRPRLVAPPECY